MRPTSARSHLLRRGRDLCGTVFHSDQGSVYTSYAYVKALAGDLGQISYSRVGTPGDNAEVESFFGRLKDEWGDLFAEAGSEKEVRALIAEKISYYNKERLHSTISYLTPDEFVTAELAAAHA